MKWVLIFIIFCSVYGCTPEQREAAYEWVEKNVAGEMCYYVQDIGKVCVVYKDGTFSFTSNFDPNIKERALEYLKEKGIIK